MSNYETPPPVPPMALSFSQGSSRPGLVVAIGIVSIVFAAWIILLSMFMVLHMTMMGFMGAMPMATPVMPTTVPTTMPTTSGVTVNMTTNVPMTMTTVDIRPESSTVIWLSVTTFANFVLSIVLLWAGIAVLRRRKRGRSLHKFWAIAKIILIFLLCYAEYLYMGGMFSSMMNSMPTSPPAPTQMFEAMSMVGAFFNLIFGLVYPVTLLFLLRMKSIREYFERVAT